MNEARTRLLGLKDERLPAMTAMLGRDAVDLLGAAVSAAGASALSARPVQITWRPGGALIVTYDVQVAWDKNRRSHEQFVASTGTHLPEGALLLAREDQQVAVWRMTADPALPGLAVAMDPRRVGDVLAGLGVAGTPSCIQLRAYRPGRRAVVEISGPGYRLFVKVVRPAKVPELQARHRVMAEALPVPRSHGWSREYGLVVLEALAGTPLRDALLDTRHPLPKPDAFAQLLDRMPDVPNGRNAPSALSGVGEYGCLLQAVLPELRDRVGRLLHRISSGRNSFPAVPTHGDLHEAQVLVSGGELVGLLDIDTAGTGYRIDDCANLVGHLAAWQTSAPAAARKRIEAFTLGVLAAADAEIGDPAEVRRRVAAVILGLATGPFRAQTPTWPADTRARVALAERWMDRSNGAP
jgi:Phosphotransferase enzyme family